MASSSSAESVTVNKGDQVSVTVEESSANIISVKFTSGGKCYRGILLQDDTSQYGVNPERVHGAPFWPPLSSSCINLKTTPCSTERYSYKFEGQPSALTVFQPEVIKRSNRNQPAPQLSRILRPRRFVCRKCKKAYHVEEENGVEMSSAALSLQIERSNQESVVASSDNGTALVPSPNSSISKVLRGSRSKLTLSDDASQSQSIRRVTPSIIPKLNDDYGLSGRESEADSNSDDAVVVRQKKVGIVERPVTNEELAVTPVKTVIPAKRKMDYASKPNRSKKVKRTTSELPNSHGVSVTNKNCPDKFCTSMEPIESIAVTMYPDDQRVPLASTNNPLSTESVSQLSAQASDCPQALNKIEDAVVRKNRIKAQYVSVATPFRFPPSRSSKPNLFANNPFGIGSREKTTAPKRARNGDPNPKKTKSDNDVYSSNSPRKSNCSTVSDLSAQKKPSVSDVTPIRSRTRARSNLSSTSSSVLDPLAAAPKGTSGSMICQIARSPEGVPVSVGDTISETRLIEATTTVAECDPNVDITSTISSSQTKINSPASIGQQANGTLSTQPSGMVDGANNRSKSMDYEKPKNRWIREARARRSQEERGAGLSVNPGAATVAIPASSNIEVLGSSSTGVSSPTLSRLRVRSGEGGLTNVSPVASVSPKAASNAKKRSNNSTVAIPESGIITSDEEISKSCATVSACSPREALPTVDTSNAALPVLKIKISRQRKPSSSSPNNAQYELVGSQVPEVDDLHATKSHMHDPVGCTASTAPTEINADNLGSKSALCNGSLPLPVSGVSPTLSSGSSRKGIVPTETPELGRLVKHCQLSDGVVFRVGDLVWSKLSGWPYWPAQITSIHQSVNSEQEIDGELDSEQQGTKPVSYTACLHWFAWHQVSYMTCDKLYHFMQHYKRFDNKKKRGVFRQAVNEARQAADKKQNAPSSPSDSEFGENEEVVYSSNPSTAVLPSTCMLNSELDSNGAPQDCISATSANTVTVVALPNEAVESDEGALSTILDVNQIVASSVPVSSSLSQRTPTSGPARRGMSRGRSRSLRGRRGGRAGPSTRIQSGARNLPSFLSPSESDVKTPYDQFDEMDSVQAPLPFRRQAPWSTRGRGARNKETGLVINPTVNVSNATASPSLPVSTGSLKIKLSTAHFRSPSTKKRQSAKSKTTKKRTKPIPKSGNSLPSSDPISGSPVSTTGPTPSASSNVSSNPNHPSAGCSDLLTDFQSNYDEPSEAILSQFPDVFQDPRPGVLSDAVEIPTFSEDESEEENAGRLIIDPEVMAAVNVSSAVHAPAPQNSVPSGKSENATPQSALYGTSSYFSTTPASINALRTNLDPLFAHSASSLLNPHRSQSAEVAFASKASLQPSVPPSTNPALLYHPAGFSSHATNTTTSTVLPFPIKENDELPCSSRSRTLDLFDPTLNPRSSYFRPSSHIGVASVTTPSAVPYVTSDYPTR